MTDVPRNDTYFVTDTDETIGRLIRFADLQAANVRDGFRRTDLAPGDKVIDVGCGPLGALRELSDLVGPRGTVVGLDMDPASLQRARTILDRDGRENVQLVHGNINAEASDELRRLGPFDAAYCRLLLFHQPDPAETLRHMAALVRPGGYIVAHEMLLNARLPRSVPEVPEIDQILQWLWDVGLRRGASPDVARHFHTLCQRTGIWEVSQRLFSWVASHDTWQTIRVWRDSVGALRPLLLQYGIASEEMIDRVVARLTLAEGWEFEVLFPALYVEIVAQFPSLA